MAKPKKDTPKPGANIRKPGANTPKPGANIRKPGAKKPKGEVVELTAGPAGTKRLRPQQKRRLLLALSFGLCVLAPIIAAIFYYFAIASDRYASSAGFSVRGVDAGMGLDGIGALTGLASTGSTTSDSYIVLEYLQSRKLVEDLDAKLDLRGTYSDPENDFLMRLKPDATIEEFVKYWQKVISTSFDSTSGIINFEVQSFSPEHAEAVATEILRMSQSLVNDLSSQARQDALRFAEAEVMRQEERLRAALAALSTFRQQEQSVNPAATAALDIELLGALEARLVDLNARIAAIENLLDENAPSLVALHRQKDALLEQIAARRAQISGTIDIPNGTSDQLTTFETLEVERRFAEESYASALNSLEQARRDADRKQRYLAIHLQPSIPQDAAYPERIKDTAIVSFVFFAFWSIATLLTYSVRDHLS